MKKRNKIRRNIAKTFTNRNRYGVLYVLGRKKILVQPVKKGYLMAPVPFILNEEWICSFTVDSSQ